MTTTVEVASNIVVSGAKIYYAPVATALPANTLAVNAPWLTPWQYLGYTLEPTKFMYKFDTLDIYVQQTMAEVSRTRTKENASFETTLAEHTTGNLALALAGESLSYEADATNPAVETFTVGGDTNLPVQMWGIEGSYTNAAGVECFIRVFLWKATAAEGGDVAWDREKPAGIPLQIKALADTSKPKRQHLMKVIRMVAPHTS